MKKDKMSFFCSIQNDVSHAPTNLPKSIKDKFLNSLQWVVKTSNFWALGTLPNPLWQNKKMAQEV
jgi:hypothetical protein